MSILSPSTLPSDFLADATRRQQDAAHPDRSVWVSASAGTGKTTVLTNRVLALLLNGVAPQHLLCLTFTKAAAAEMANRVTRQLGRWAVATDAVLTAEIERATGLVPDATRLARARRLFGLVLDTPGGLKIQTIHAFCQSLLARFPLEAGVSQRFRVMGDADAAETLAEARAIVIARAQTRHDPALSKAFDLMTLEAGETTFTSLIEQLNSERRHLLALGETTEAIDAYCITIAEALGVDPGASSASHRAAFIAELRADRTRLADIARRFGASAGGEIDADIAATLGDALTRLDAPGTGDDWADESGIALENDPIALFIKACLTEKHLPRKKPPTKALGLADPALRDDYAQLQQRALRYLDARRAIRSYETSAALARVGHAVLWAYQRLKTRQGWLDYDDLILKAIDLLEQEGGASWVHYKLDGGLHHILIDEAQDTNPDQWAVVKALTAEFFSGDGASGVERTIFVVGDAKQSIFSFQRADPQAFIAMRSYFESRVQAAGQQFRTIALTHSFRSTEAVLGVVDQVFANPQAADGVGDLEDGGVRHLASRLGLAGVVELWPPAPEQDKGGTKAWQLPLEPVATEPPQQQTARLIARTIRSWLERGEMLEAQGRPIRAGDIMILVRKRGTLVPALVRALKREGVPVAGADRMALQDQLAVQDLVALAEFVLLPQDDLTLACVLKSPLIGLTEDHLFALAHGATADGAFPGRIGPDGKPRRSLWRQLRRMALAEDAVGPFRQAFERLSEWRNRADTMPPYEFFASILSGDGMRRQMLARLGEEAADPMEEFLAQTMQYERGHVPSLQGFLHWLGSGTLEIKRETDATARDEVRIMTAHGSKGLQAPIVFLADAAQRGRATGARLLWVDAPTSSRQPSPHMPLRLPLRLPLWAPRQADMGDAVLAAKAAKDAADLAEYRRLLYVAMTRAEDRLYILGWGTPKEETWHSLTLAALRGLSRPDAPFAATPVELDFEAQFGLTGWRGTGYRVAFGSAGSARAPGTALHNPTPGALPAWAFQPAPPEASPARPLAPSRLGEEPAARSPGAVGLDASFQRGRLIHRLLQTLPDLPDQDRRAAALRFLAAPTHGLAEAEQTALADETLAVLAHPDFAPLFGPQSRAEVPVVGLIGTQSVVGQIDRIAVTAEEVLLIDYKTNRPPPRSAEGVSVTYLRQLAAYRALMAQIYPGRRIRCALLWTDGPRLMPIPDPLLDAHSSLDGQQGTAPLASG